MRLLSILSFWHTAKNSLASRAACCRHAQQAVNRIHKQSANAAQKQHLPSAYTGRLHNSPGKQRLS